MNMKDEIVSRVMSEMGRKGGKKGGKARMDALTPKQRTALAKKAAAASAKVRAKKAARRKG
jgi:hypothetical protein